MNKITTVFFILIIQYSFNGLCYNDLQVSQTDKNTMNIENIVFDLDGVLIETNKYESFLSIGIYNTLNYIFRNLTIPSEEIFLNFLHKIDSDNKHISYHNNKVICWIFLCPHIK